MIKTVNGKETSDHFNLDCTEEDVCIAEDGLPILDVEWKWSSTYMLLGRSKELRPALDEIASNNDDFKENQLSSTDWDGIDSVLEFLQPFAKAFKYVEGVKNPSLPVVVPLYNHLLKKAQDFANCKSNPELVRKGAVLACNKMSNHSPMLAVVTAMDPRMKYKYFNETGSSAHRNTFETVVKPTYVITTFLFNYKIHLVINLLLVSGWRNCGTSTRTFLLKMSQLKIQFAPWTGC